MAVFDEVELDGTTVSKASLHNWANVRRLALHPGDAVLVEKANEIIPQIGEVLEPGDKDIVLDVCPACGGPLETVNGQQFCTNPNCKERIAQNIAFLGQKDVLDIPGLSIQTARKIVDKHGMAAKDLKQNIIFNLKLHNFQMLPGFADKSAQKLYDAIQSARENVELPRFIKALCIPGIGNDVGKLLAERYADMDAIMWDAKRDESESDIERMMEIPGIGPVTAKALCSDEFWHAVGELEHYITPLPAGPTAKKDVVVGEFVGKTFVLTGKMAHPRSYYEELIAKAGAKTGSGVSKSTDYLVIADVNSTSTKAKKARELGTKLISPEELEEMLQ